MRVVCLGPVPGNNSQHPPTKVMGGNVRRDAIISDVYGLRHPLAARANAGITTPQWKITSIKSSLFGSFLSSIFLILTLRFLFVPLSHWKSRSMSFREMSTDWRLNIRIKKANFYKQLGDVDIE